VEWREGGAALPYAAVWDHFCETRGAPLRETWLEALRAHARRGASRLGSVETPPRPEQEAPADGSGPPAATPAERLFGSAEVKGHKAAICDIGRRLWQRAYVDGNGGNLSVRITDDLVLCTPTLVSKGFMTPEDLCLVDMNGVQRAGSKRATSEILMHLAIYRAQPLARACVHAHPPEATGFAVARVPPPSGLIPEMEIFCGLVPLAPYFTPGTHQVGEAVAALAERHTTILMGNHGAVAWGVNVEDAYFKMEILESYCRTVQVATRLKDGPHTFTADELRELLAIKERLGLPDPRLGTLT
jgi:L-fuculose-phosphate aldolase